MSTTERDARQRASRWMQGMLLVTGMLVGHVLVTIVIRVERPSISASVSCTR